MHRALVDILGSLPGDTLVYCGHEYALQNLRYALHVEPGNLALQAMMAECEGKRERGEPTVPTTISQEKSYNPFMRVGEPGVQEFTACGSDTIEVMRVLRERKDSFK